MLNVSLFQTVSKFKKILQNLNVKAYLLNEFFQI